MGTALGMKILISLHLAPWASGNHSRVDGPYFVWRGPYQRIGFWDLKGGFGNPQPEGELTALQYA